MQNMQDPAWRRSLRQSFATPKVQAKKPGGRVPGAEMMGCNDEREGKDGVVPHE